MPSFDSALRPQSAWLARASELRLPWATLGSFALVAGTGAANGGYFPSSWGLPTLLAAWIAALVLAVREDAGISRDATLALGALTAFVCWTVLSTVWSTNVTEAVLSAERTTLYVAAALAALLCARRSPEQLLHGAWAGSVVLCSWALATRLVPDRFGVSDPIAGYRLDQPIGYWNALGLLAAMGALLGLGIAARGRSPLGRAVGAAGVPICITTLYFTFSRGAWIALACGLVAAVALAPRRVQVIAVAVAVAPFTAVVVWRASVSSALTTVGSPLATAAHEGHRLLPVLAGCAVGAAVLALLAARVDPDVNLGPQARRLIAIALAAAVVAAVFVALPAEKRAWHTFATAGTSSSANLNSRLFQIGGNGRLPQWRVAWRDAAANPILGSGAGTYQEQWFLHRPTTSRVRNAHNLYLETLAELGPLGLALLVCFLAIPIVVAFRRRHRPLAFAAFGVYVAFVLHVIVDWDWQIASVSLVAVLAAAALLADGAVRFSRWQRWLALAAAGVLGAAGIYTFASQIPMTRLAKAEAQGNWTSAERQAKHAAALAPWSEDPWLSLGEAELNAGRTADAVVALQKAAAKTPDDWTPWYDLARASTGSARAADLARARALNPLEPELATLGAGS